MLLDQGNVSLFLTHARSVVVLVDHVGGLFLHLGVYSEAYLTSAMLCSHAVG